MTLFRNNPWKINRLILSAVSLMVALPTQVQADGLFRSKSGSICEQAEAAGLKPLRRTLVYVDSQALSRSPDEQGWFYGLSQALRQTMTTAEPLEVIVLNSSKGTAKSYGETLCYPMIAEKYQEQFKSTGLSGILTNDLVDQLPEMQKEFDKQMQDLIGPAYVDAPASLPHSPPSQVKEHHLLRALQSDAARFSSDVPTRVLIYSDMVENSDVAALETILSATSEDEMVKVASQAQEKLPRLDFQGSMVYGFGTGTTLDSPVAAEAINTFWQQLVFMANGHPVAFSRELAMKPLRPVSSTLYDMTVSFPKKDVIGQVLLLPDEEGNITDSYLDMGVDGRSSHFEKGRLVCNANNTCQFEGRLATGVAFVGNDPESVYLEGSPAELKGHLGFRNDKMADSDNPALLPIKATKH